MPQTLKPKTATGVNPPPSYRPICHRCGARMLYGGKSPTSGKIAFACKCGGVIHAYPSDLRTMERKEAKACQ